MTTGQYIASLVHYLLPIKAPKLPQSRKVNLSHIAVAVIIPSYRPTSLTKDLAYDICRFNDDLDLQVILVDDSSPKESKKRFRAIQRACGERVTIIRTPSNRLKAGAINYGLDYIRRYTIPPDVVFTLDDDITVRRGTIKAMIKRLLRNDHLGAVCSLAQVANKNRNLLTRLQGLEYNSFNIIRTADSNFIQGPLVMHGMATAFRYKALDEIGGFTPGHLIEDYDITARLKNHDWHVALSPDAQAYTLVPETLGQLWRQRVRWSTGGVKVLLARHKVMSIFQDIIGHSLFLSTLVLIGLSLMLPYNSSHSTVAYFIFVVSLGSFMVNYLFSIYMLVFYRECDAVDFLIRCSIVLELLYSFMLTFVLIGAYIFSTYIYMTRKVLKMPIYQRKYLDALFRKIGYSETWGTR